VERDGPRLVAGPGGRDHGPLEREEAPRRRRGRASRRDGLALGLPDPPRHTVARRVPSEERHEPACPAIGLGRNVLLGVGFRRPRGKGRGPRRLAQTADGLADRGFGGAGDENQLLRAAAPPPGAGAFLVPRPDGVRLSVPPLERDLAQPFRENLGDVAPARGERLEPARHRGVVPVHAAQCINIRAGEA
jgi:hypothetical protein